MKISIAHSPDLDDEFMFWAIKNKLVDSRGFEFSFQTADTASLNSIAKSKSADVVAVSAAIFPLVKDNYSLLSSGASIGRGYGPVVVSYQLKSLDELKNKRISVPGISTSAANLLKHILPQHLQIEVSIEPFELVFENLKNKEVDAALLIHEGQICYKEKDKNLNLCLDLGQWWNEKYKLPLPLGINIINNSLPKSTRAECDLIFRESIQYALNNKENLLIKIADSAKETRGLTLSSIKLHHQYLDMYVNKDTLEMDDDCINGLEKLWSILS